MNVKKSSTKNNSKRYSDFSSYPWRKREKNNNSSTTIVLFTAKELLLFHLQWTEQPSLFSTSCYCLFNCNKQEQLPTQTFIFIMYGISHILDYIIASLPRRQPMAHSHFHSANHWLHSLQARVCFLSFSLLQVLLWWRQCSLKSSRLSTVMFPNDQSSDVCSV